MEDNLCNLKSIKQTMSEHNFRASKLMGQNFLTNKNICSKIAYFSQIDNQTSVIEIGPGMGALTFELAKVSKKVVAVELDKRLVCVLDTALKKLKNTKVIQGDILKLDIKRMIYEEFSGANIVVCANLPYSITSPIIMRLLEERIPIKAVVVMVQKEAAKRICSKVGTRNCGAISASVEYFSEPKILFNVSRGNFFPIPKVDSSVIRLKIRNNPFLKIKSEKLFFEIIRVGFLERRKAIKNPLVTRTNFSKQQILRALEKSQISPLARAENICIEGFAKLSNAIFRELKKTPKAHLDLLDQTPFNLKT
ncbi:MAG: 16S rRNA (adenine(1518)-N(6)/adenine(1519)-N(6))-dimethyltransferase RsmA [Oscillospiraceae bacterium]|jgi:16S rRNA (adenine1518-N6/adenine1519-N6)-dimethyltransferase|nr:16S rRNA (adenine(1518)-N(6)/adenine(1519)-N(6))-dimethyltransferase RsmA [Oscillospiraceae bacterium]